MPHRALQSSILRSSISLTVDSASGFRFLVLILAASGDALVALTAKAVVLEDAVPAYRGACVSLGCSTVCSTSLPRTFCTGMDVLPLTIHTLDSPPGRGTPFVAVIASKG
jgi:hypothetical protein